MQWQEPRVACLSEIREAYRSGKAISQDFRFQSAAVYAFAFPSLGLIKVGISNDVDARLVQIEKQENATGELVWSAPGNRQFEMKLHRLFRPWRVRGEWFSDCAAIREHLTSLTRAGAR